MICPLCSRSTEKLFYKTDDLILYKCSCGFVFHNQQTEYNDQYSIEFAKTRKFMYPDRAECLRDIVQRIRKYKPAGNLLDIGCGDGHFLSYAKDYYDISGIEPSYDLSVHASKILSIPVVHGYYPADLKNTQKSDIITMIQVMEHIPNPVKILEHIYNNLSQGGLVVIEIPSISAPHFLLYRLTGIKRFVNNPYGIIKNHVGYYSPKRFLSLMNSIGFKKIELTTGRWQVKYKGTLKSIAKIIDPVFNMLRIGGILYIGTK